jgi:dihydroflavonol-4-reductase
MLVRKTSNLTSLEGVAGDTHVGDLAQPESLAPALTGCDAVVHVAADYRLWIPDPAAMYRANVDGTRELLRLAREAGVPRFVYTSSVATMHFRRDGIVINEDTPVTLADMVGHYKRSKFLAEQEAIKAAGVGQSVVILNPTTPSAPTTRSPPPPAASSSTFSTAVSRPTWTRGSIWWTLPRSPAPTWPRSPGASPATATSWAAKT